MLPACQKLVALARQSIQEISWEDLDQVETCNRFVIDVREPEEFKAGSIPGAFNVPRGLLEFKIHNCPDLEALEGDELLSAPLYLFCATGGRSALAAQSLKNLGFTRVSSIRGGLELKP